MKFKYNKQKFPIFIKNLSFALIIMSIWSAFGIYVYALVIPYNGIRGDAYQYMSIAEKFSTLYDAFFFTGDRTYGFPLFLYIIKYITSPINYNTWRLAASVFQFMLHIMACCVFSLFFLKSLFQKAKLPKLTTVIVTSLLITYPVFVTYTTIPLTDTFCTDLLMIVTVLYSATFRNTNKRKSFICAALCGLILSYIIMVRPSFLPVVIIFNLVLMIKIITQFKYKRSTNLKSMTIVFFTTILVLPSLFAFQTKHKNFSIQNTEFIKNSTQKSLEAGLSAVRVYWTNHSNVPLPGVRDPFLTQHYSDKCFVNSLKTLTLCLASDPLAIPVYFWKKTIALFDEKYFQPYVVLNTPNWFTNWQRCFEVLPFCGFLNMILFLFSYPFLKRKPFFIDLPLVIFVTAFVFTQSLFHVEGRYGFPAIPLSLTAFFLGYSVACKHKTILFVWSIVMLSAAIAFYMQIFAWDRILPI